MCLFQEIKDERFWVGAYSRVRLFDHDSSMFRVSGYSQVDAYSMRTLNRGITVFEVRPLDL